MGPPVLAIDKGQPAHGYVLHPAPQQRRELILPIGCPDDDAIRRRKLAGIAEHGAIKLPGHLKLVALAQRVAVQGANVLLVQAQLFDHSVRILGLDHFQPRAAQLQGPRGLAPDAAVDK